jgi:sensor histidine kinase YesM
LAKKEGEFFMKAIFKKWASVMLVIAVMLSVVVPFSVTTASAATITADSYINYATLPYEEGLYKSSYDDEAEAMMAEEGVEIKEVDEDDGTVDFGEEL